MEQPKHVLDGYRVLDFSQVLAGPTVTRLDPQIDGLMLFKSRRAARALGH